MVHSNAEKLPKVLVVEDEKNVGLTLVERLRKENFEVTWATSAQEAQTEIEAQNFDLSLMDVGLPDGTGFGVAAFLRARHPQCAIIFLTAFGNPEDRVRGLELGAEDYIVKPFHLKELILRIQNGLKRAKFLAQSAPAQPEVVELGKAKVHLSRFQAEVDGQIVSLTHKEVALLQLLLERRGQVVSRDEILNQVWSENEFPTTRTVDNFILRLRKLVEPSPEEPQVIKSIRGVGYQLL
jgi:two-component system, OmpR family, alkaline phosphatase synthesis response regulator PhoP